MFTNFQTMMYKKPGNYGYFWPKHPIWPRPYWKNTARKSCFGRPEHIDGLPGTQLLEKDEMYEGAYGYRHRSPPQAYHHQAYHEYSKHQRNFPSADYRNYKFNENKENKHGPESLAYYLPDRREPGYRSSRSPGERRQSSSPRNKPPYDKRERAEHGRKSSTYRSPRGSYEGRSRSFHSRSPYHRSSNSPRGSASRSSSRHRSSIYSSNRSWKRSREREKRQRSRSSSKSESSSEGAVFERKISPKIKNRRDKHGSPEREDSHEKGIKRPMSSVCKIVNEKKRYHFSKHALKNRDPSINDEKLKKEEKIGLEKTLDELSMSPISSEDFSQRSGEAESDGEVEDCVKKAQKESKNESIGIKKKENGCSDASNSISSQNQEQIMQKDDIEEVQAGEQEKVNNLLSQQYVEMKAVTKDIKLIKSSGDKIQHEKGHVNKKNISDSDSKPENSQNKQKCKNTETTKEKSEKVSLNVEDNCTENNASALKSSEENKNHKDETWCKNEVDQNQTTSNIEKLEHTLIESNTKLNSKIMPREMVSKIMLLIGNRGKNSEIPTECNKIQNEQTDCQKEKKEQVGYRENMIKNRTNILPEDESKSEDKEKTDVTNISESCTNDEKYHKNSAGGSSEEITKKVEDKNKEKPITKNQKSPLNIKEDKSKETKKLFCRDQKKYKKNNDKFSDEKDQIDSFNFKKSENFVAEKCNKSTDKASGNKKMLATTDEANKKSTNAHNDFQNNCTNRQNLKCRDSPDYVSKNIHESTLQKQLQSSINCVQGQKSNITLQGSCRNQEKISSRNTKDKLNQTPINLDQSHSHTLSLKDKRKCFEECIQAREKNESHSKYDSGKNEQTSKVSHKSPEQDKNKQEKKSEQDNIERNKDNQQKSKKLEDVPAKMKERRHSGTAHELLNTKVRMLSGDSSGAKSQSCDESSPAVVKGTINRPTGNVFYPLGKASEKKRKLSPPNKATQSTSNFTHDLGNGKKSKLSIPMIEEPRVPVTDIKNKPEEYSPNATVQRNDLEESASGPKRSLFGKNKKRVSHCSQIDNQQIGRRQIQTTILGLSQRKSPSQNTKTNILKKFTARKVSGSPVKSQIHRRKPEKNTAVESSGTDIKQIKEVRVSHSDNIFERIKKSNEEDEGSKAVSENFKAGVKRTLSDNCKSTISDKKKRKHEENNKVTSVQEKLVSTFKDKTDTKYKSERKSTGDDKLKIASSDKQTEIQQKTSSLSTVIEMFGESGESKKGGRESDFCKSITPSKIAESDRSQSEDSTATSKMLNKYTKTNASENVISIQSKCHKEFNESRFEGNRINFDVSNTKSNESSKVVYNQANGEGQLKESSKENSHLKDNRRKSKELCKEVSHEANNKEKSEEQSKLTSVKASHLEKSKESSRAEREALSCEKIEKRANSGKKRNGSIGTETTIFNDFKEPKSQVEVERERGENTRKRTNAFDSEEDSTEEPEVLDKENGMLKSAIEIKNAFDDISEPENFKTFETEMKSDTDDDDSDVGDIEPIEMIGSVFINDACKDELDENEIDYDIKNTEMESFVEGTETAIVQIKYSDDHIVIHNTDDSRKVQKGKESVSDANDKSQQTNETETKTKTTPRKRFAPQLETLGKLMEDEKELDDFEREKMETHTHKERNKAKKGQSYESEDDDDSELISSGVEISPAKEKTSTTTSQWLEKAKKKLKVPENLIKAKECLQTTDSERVADIVPETPEQHITFNKTVFEKGFGVSHMKQLKNGKFAQTNAHFFPKKLYRTSSGEGKNLGKCLLCQSCSMFFTPLTFTVHHDTQSVVEQIDTEKSKQQGYSLVERGDADTIKMFEDFTHYFQAERRKHYGSSPVTLPQTKTPTEEEKSLVSEDKDLCVTLKGIEGATEAPSATNMPQVVQSHTKSAVTSATGVVSQLICKGNMHLQPQMHLTSVDQMKQANQTSELAQVNQIHAEQQVQLAEKQQNVSQTDQTSCDQQIQQVQKEIQQFQSLPHRMSENQPVKTKEPSEQPAKSHVPQASGDQWRQESQTSQPQTPNNMNLMLAGHSKLTAEQQHRKTLQTTELQLTISGQQRPVKQMPLKKNKRQEQRTTLQYILPHGSQNQQGQISQLAGQHLLPQVQYTGPHTSRTQVNQPSLQEYHKPDRKTSHQNTSVPINVLPKQSIPNNCQQDQLYCNNVPGFQQCTSQNVLSTKNIGTVPMFNPLTALYMNQPVYSENRAVNRSDYTGIPVAAPSSVLIPSTQVTQQGPGQTIDTTVWNINYTMTFENMEMPGVREPAKAGSSAQSAQPALRQTSPPEKEHISRQMSNEVETVVNAGTVEEKRRNLIKQLLELDNIHTGDGGLDLILFGRKYVSRGLASVNQEVLRLYRERTTNTAVQPQLPQRNGNPVTVEERAYYMGQLRRSQHQ